MHVEITDVRTLRQPEPKIRRMEFRNQTVSLGSHSDNLVQLPDLAVAPHHADLLVNSDGQWAYHPKTRDDPAKINDAPINGEVEIKDGDVLELSYFSLKFTMDLEVVNDEPKVRRPGDLAKIKQYPLPQRSLTRRADVKVNLAPARQAGLGRLSRQLRDCTTLADLLEQTAQALLPLLEARMVWIGVRTQAKGPLEYMYGYSEEGGRSGEPPMAETFIYRCLERDQFICIPKVDENTQSILAVPIPGDPMPLGLIYADTRRFVRMFDEADLDMMTAVTHLVAAHLDAILHGDREQRAKLADEGLAVLRVVQAQMQSFDVPRWRQLDLATHFLPGHKRAGDVFDLLKLPNGLAAVLIAHVKADPTQAALVMTQLRSAFRVAGLHADRPHIQLRAWNWLLSSETTPCEVHVASFVANPKSGVAEYCTAGNIGGVILTPDGKPRILADPDSPPIGKGQNTEYAPHSERLLGDETVAFYTGGCMVACNEDGEPLGERQFVKVLRDNCGQSAASMMDDVLADLDRYLKVERTPHDISLVLMHHGPDGVRGD